MSDNKPNAPTGWGRVPSTQGKSEATAASGAKRGASIRPAPIAPPAIREAKPKPKAPVRHMTMDVDMSWLEPEKSGNDEGSPKRPSRRPSAPPKRSSVPPKRASIPPKRSSVPPKRGAPPELRGAGARHHTLEVRAEWLELEQLEAAADAEARGSSRNSRPPKADTAAPSRHSRPPRAVPPPLPAQPSAVGSKEGSRSERPSTRPRRAIPPPLPREEEADDRASTKRPSRRPAR